MLKHVPTILKQAMCAPWSVLGAPQYEALLQPLVTAYVHLAAVHLAAVLGRVRGHV